MNTMLGRRRLLTAIATSGLAGALPFTAFAQDDAAGGETGAFEVQEMFLGDPDAPVTFIEYGSFTCPHCATFHANQFQELQRDYIDTGKVKFIFREVYFDRFALWASMIARCGGSTRFFGIHDLIFETQADWIAGGQDPALIVDNLKKIGITAGLEAEQVEACMQDEAMAQALVNWFQANAEEDGIEATPTLFINGTKYSNMAYSDIQPLIEAALAG